MFPFEVGDAGDVIGREGDVGDADLLLKLLRQRERNDALHLKLVWLKMMTFERP